MSFFTSNAWFVYLSDGTTGFNTKTGPGKAVCVPKDFDLAVYLKEKT
jgi:hypothetical protein